MNFVNRLKHAQHKTFCNCIHISNFFEGDDLENMVVCLTSVKNRKLYIKNVLIGKKQKLLKKFWLRTSFLFKTTKSVHQIELNSARSLKWTGCYDKYFEKKIFDLLGICFKIF